MATLYASQTPLLTGNDNEHSLGNRFTFTSSGFSAVRGRVWVPSGGLAASNTVWQLWKVTGAVLLAEFDLTTLTGETPNTWSPWFDITPVALNTTDTYIVCWHMPTGDPGYVYSAQTFPLTNGPFTADTGIYTTGQPSSVIPSDTFAAIYFADIEATSGAGDVTVNLATETDTSFGFTASSVVDGTVELAAEIDTAFGFTPSAGTSDAVIDLATETDTAFAFTASSAVDGTIGLGVEVDTAFTFTPSGGAPVVTTPGDLSATHYANQLAGTLISGVPTLTLNAALVKWATDNGATNTDGLTDVGALNRAFAAAVPQWGTRNAILNEEAGTDDLSDTGALNDLANP